MVANRNHPTASVCLLSDDIEPQSEEDIVKTFAVLTGGDCHALFTGLITRLGKLLATEVVFRVRQDGDINWRQSPSADTNGCRQWIS